MVGLSCQSWPHSTLKVFNSRALRYLIQGVAWMAKVVVFGTSQWAELSHFYLTEDSPHEVVAFTLDRDYIESAEFRGLPVVPFDEMETHYPPEDFKMFIPMS